MDIDDEPDFRTADHSSDEKAVNAELNARYAGTISFFAYQMDSNWTNTFEVVQVSNRKVDNAWTKTLEAKFRENGLLRTTARHHMHVTTTQENLHRILTVLLGGVNGFEGTANSFASLSTALKAINEQAECPKLLPVLKEKDETILPLTCQAGQHRWKALEVYHNENAKELWWPCRIYLEPISAHALARLRDNSRPPQLDLSDGERLLQFHCYQEEVKKIQDQLSKLYRSDEPEVCVRLEARSRDAKGTAEELRSEFPSPTRLKTLLKRPTIFEGILAAVKIPALARDFSIGSIGDLLALKAEDVHDPIHI
jgi:hypothetical protein